MYGMANDTVTFSISRDYFIYGKGLGWDISIGGALVLGAQAGFVAGLIGGMIFLIFNSKCKASYRYLLCLIRYPIIFAFFCGVIFSFVLSGQDPLGYVEIMSEALSPAEMDNFMRVWWTHCGTYFGFFVGVVYAVTKLR